MKKQRKKRTAVEKLYLVVITVGEVAVFKELFLKTTKHGVKSDKVYKDAWQNAEDLDEGTPKVTMTAVTRNGPLLIAAKIDEDDALLIVNV